MSREETQFACQEDDKGNRLRFQTEELCVESSQIDEEAVHPPLGLGVDSIHRVVQEGATKGESTSVAQCPEGAQAGGWDK